MYTALKSVLLASVLALGACQSGPPHNRGSGGGRIDPTADAPSEYGSQSLRSGDLITATNLMAQDIAQRLDIVNRQSPPKIVLGQVSNKTSRPQANFQVFLARLQSLLQQSDSGTRHGLEFIVNRDTMEKYRDREYGNKDSASSAAAYKSRADYVLTCDVYDLPSGGSEFYSLHFILFQMRDASSGPDKGAGAEIWRGMYEVKFQ